MWILQLNNNVPRKEEFQFDYINLVCMYENLAWLAVCTLILAEWSREHIVLFPRESIITFWMILILIVSCPLRSFPSGLYKVI